jgi:hypothetical protein
LVGVMEVLGPDVTAWMKQARGRARLGVVCFLAWALT